MIARKSWMACLSLLVCALILTGSGCGGAPSPKDKPKPEQESKEEHGHAHAGPHDGALVEWGNEEYHPEFTVDHDKKEARVYILGPDARKPAPIEAEKITLSLKQPALQLELKAEPQKGDPAGKSSCFVIQHEVFGKVQPFAGTISGEVKGKPYAGDFKEEEDGHDHKK